MGAVYRARDTELGRDVAIKFIAAQRDGDPDRRARFAREARTLASLNHPNIGAIYGFADDGATRGLVLELVEGETLAARIARGPVRLSEALRFGRQIAAALEAAHAKGIVHRDLKPANITITHDGSVKVLDFGLAKAVAGDDAVTVAAPAGVTQPGAVMGTPRYMSPEQARGLAVDRRTDIWALGCVLYESLAGRPAFPGASSPDVLAAVLEHEPDFAALPSGTPRGVVTAIRGCLEKDPARRLADAATVHAALDRAPSGPERPASSGSAAVRWTSVLVVAAAAVGAVGWVVWTLARGPDSRRGPDATNIRAVVVRPLENLSRDPSQDYFAEGMTDAITTQLARVGSLRVASRTSALRFRDQPVAAMARALKVDGVVEGSVLFAGDSVRVTARLIDAASDTSVWADSYERGVGDVLRLQREIARDIAAKIHGASSIEAVGTTAPIVDADAYREYLKGRYLWNRRTPDALQQAIAHFERAVALQPDYAPAHSGIAETLVLMSAQGIGSTSPQETLPRVRAAAQRALELDETLASAHAALGRERLQMWDWAAAESEGRRAIELDPNDASAHFWFASTLASLGRHDESIVEAGKAVALDPVAPIVLAGMSWMYHFARRFDEALVAARRVLELEPSFPIAQSRVGEALLGLGRPSEALEPFRRALDASGGSPDYVAMLGLAQGRAGRRQDAVAARRTLLEQRRTRYVSEYNLALVAIGLGDRTAAINWLEQAYSGHAWAMAFMNVDPTMDPLRADPAFRALVRRLGLTPDASR